jgi:hypothetical protein
MDGLRALPEWWAGWNPRISASPMKSRIAEFGEPLEDDPAASETPTSGNPSHPRKFRESLPPPIEAELPGQVKPRIASHRGIGNSEIVGPHVMGSAATLAPRTAGEHRRPEKEFGWGSLPISNTPVSLSRI